MRGLNLKSFIRIHGFDHSGKLYNENHFVVYVNTASINTLASGMGFNQLRVT